MAAIPIFGNLVLHVAPNQLYFCQAHLKTFWIVIREEVPIHITALRVASIIARDDTIRVYYWHNPEFIIVPQLVGQRIFRHQKVNKSMDDKRRVSFTRVLPPNYYNNWLFIEFAFGVPV